MSQNPVLTPSPALRAWGDLPGPRAWPVVGNGLQLGGRRMHLQLERWARDYGGTYRLTIGPRRFVVLTDPEQIASVLRDRPDGFRRSKRLEDVSRSMGFLGLFSASGDTWRRQRPMVLGSFDPAHIREFFPTLVRVTERLAKRWHTAATRDEPIDVQADLMLYTVDVTAALAFGEDINTIESPREEGLQQHLNHVLPALIRQVFAPVPALLKLQWRRQRETRQHIEALREAVEGFIARTRERLYAHPERRERPANLIEAMVAARDRDTELTDEDVSGNVLTMLLAGEDTTANTLAWTIWLLSRHPEALRQAQEEAREVLDGAACAAGTEQLARMDWIDACAQEAMRMKPVAPFIAAEALADHTVGDVHIARGEVAFCLMRPAGTSEARFPQSGEFRPERWLRGEGDAAHSLASARRVVMPFGAGPRICPGRYLALAEIKMCLSMLLANFDIATVTAPGGEPAEEVALTMYPVGLQMRLRPRPGQSNEKV